MIERDQFLNRYFEWCLANQESEVARDFPTLLWAGGPDVEASFDYARRSSITPGDFFVALLTERLDVQYGFKISAPLLGVNLDYSDFDNFRIAHLRNKMTDVNFAYVMMLRSRNRKRDRAIAREVQASLEAVGWQKFRLTPSELGASFLIERNVELRVEFKLPHGSLQFEYGLQCNDERWLWAESYISWFGLSGYTEVWGSTEDSAGLSGFIENQSRKLQEFVESCRD